MNTAAVLPVHILVPSCSFSLAGLFVCYSVCAKGGIMLDRLFKLHVYFLTAFRFCGHRYRI